VKGFRRFETGANPRSPAMKRPTSMYCARVISADELHAHTGVRVNAKQVRSTRSAASVGRGAATTVRFRRETASMQVSLSTERARYFSLSPPLPPLLPPSLSLSLSFSLPLPPYLSLVVYALRRRGMWDACVPATCLPLLLNLGLGPIRYYRGSFTVGNPGVTPAGTFDHI